jgi:hypothetical protein
VDVRFDEAAPGRTAVTLTHGDFERHGDGAADYREAMSSSMGWPYILERFAGAIEKR